MTSLRRFDQLRHSFSERLDSVRDLDEPAFVRSDWASRNGELVDRLLPLPPADFLRCEEILHQMFVGARYLPQELPYVLSRLPGPEIAQEDPVGDPPTSPVPGGQVTTSSNTVHQLHHLLRYQDVSGWSVGTVRSVVEWGGGYGCLAKLFIRLHGGSPTYVVLDTPVFAAVQWLYLASVLGEGEVVLHDRPGKVALGKVNIVPIGLVPALEFDADLFVSNWALNESTAAAQRFVCDRDWFGAPSLLLGMHAGDPFVPDVLSAGAVAVPLGEFMPGQQYLIR